MRKAVSPTSCSTLPPPAPQTSGLRYFYQATLLAGLLTASAALAQTPLEIYDATIANDTLVGLDPITTLTTPVTLNGSGGSAFDFGVTTGDATIEFIVEGDPSANGSSYLAVGSTTASSLRYEVWDNTGELGFTQAGVADYQFSPGVASPAEAAHVAYVWDPAAKVMKVYVNGALAGTTTNVDPAFVMPSGLGKLGANESGEEGMVGKIYRVTVYDTVLSEAAIRRHASAYGAHVSKALAAYDTSVTTDASSGLTPAAKLIVPTVLNGTLGTDFDFGVSSGDATIEFILEGDPANNNSAFLAVGEIGVSSLRYELWDNTGHLGFTQAAVADYEFDPSVPSPTQATHIAYVWNPDTTTMKVYVNGLLAGTTLNVSPNFVMPSGLGKLGSNGSNSERMSGTIFRVTVYDSILTDAALLRHAKAFTDVLHPPIVNSFVATPAAIGPGASATLTWSVENAKQIKINGVDQTSATSLTVSPAVTTTYTLTAVNAFGNASATVRVLVDPPLAAYDAIITADQLTGLVPTAKLISTVNLPGSGGVTFNFGANSGDTTMEFILEGDPSPNAGSFLAVGENDLSSLRYEAWNNTTQVGFTQTRVEDYLFKPGVPSSTWPTHLTYVWNAAATTMSIYVNGVLAGSNTNVDAAFGMPTGQGWLGCNTTGGEAMLGRIYRVTVYPGQVSADAIKRHADAFLPAAQPKLAAYDAVILAGPAPAARLYAPLQLNGTGGVAFDFGHVSGDAMIEFILQGDAGTSVSSFLAVGTNDASSLRFEVWPDTSELGFTQARVADYQFTPGVPSPSTPKHLVYAWSAATQTMKLYVNGTLAGTTTGVDAAFALPVDVGLLGSAPDFSEALTGTIYRVTVYDDILAENIIQAHATAYTGVIQPPSVAIQRSGGNVVIVLSQAVVGSHYRVEYRNSLSAADTWQTLSDLPSVANAVTQVPDLTPLAGQAQRYYRAVLVP